MNIFEKILGAATHLSGLVDMADRVIPAAGKGAQKLDLVLKIALAAYTADPELVQQIASHDYLDAVTGVVGAVVAAKKVADLPPERAALPTAP